ncbi:MAG TPA: cupin domain-containing protein [Trebonia sp.]|nr:cupin domain-containing protein [Trebonia sp.]
MDDWLNRQPTRRDLRSTDDCVIIRSSAGPRTGVSTDSAGAQALGLNLVMIPPGSRGMPHYHDGHETALYLVSGETEVWYGADLAKRSMVRAGDFIYIPPGTPHLAVNRGDVTSIAVVAKNDPADDDATVVVELPRHLAGLLGLPVAVQE